MAKIINSQEPIKECIVFSDFQKTTYPKLNLSNSWRFYLVDAGELENNLSDYIGVKHSITCANGTDALTIALLALDAKPHDAVFVPSFTYIASAEAIALIGATPYFVDVGIDYNICPTSLEIAINLSLIHI